MDALREFNRIFKEMDEIYRQVSRASGLAECAFWILYFLEESGAPLTQQQLCHSMLQPKQSVNTALKKMEADGWLTITQAQHDRRSRVIALTEAGRRIAGRTAAQVLRAERAAFGRFAPAELEHYLQLLSSHKDALASECAALIQGENA